MGEMTLWGSAEKGVSPVIATIIISAVVLTVGGAVWSFSQGASVVVADDYVEGVMGLLNEAAERFIVEHVSNDDERTTLRVWIRNYGEVNVTVDVYAYVGGVSFSTDPGNPISIASHALGCAELAFSAVSGDEVAIKVHSRRQNNAYYTHLVP